MIANSSGPECLSAGAPRGSGAIIAQMTLFCQPAIRISSHDYRTWKQRQTHQRESGGLLFCFSSNSSSSFSATPGVHFPMMASQRIAKQSSPQKSHISPTRCASSRVQTTKGNLPRPSGKWQLQRAALMLMRSQRRRIKNYGQYEPAGWLGVSSWGTTSANLGPVCMFMYAKTGKCTEEKWGWRGGQHKQTTILVWQLPLAALFLMKRSQAGDGRLLCLSGWHSGESTAFFCCSFC